MTHDPFETLSRCENKFGFDARDLVRADQSRITAAVIQASAIRELTAAVNRLADIADADSARYAPDAGDPK